MADKNVQKIESTELRRLAEERLRDETASEHPLGTEEDPLKLLHELQVYQIELEMQNEELKLTKHVLEAARDSYFDLYDLAPVGYLTLNKDALIQRINLTAATMLGLAKNNLINMAIQRFIFSEDRDLYFLQNKRAIETSEGFKLELRFLQTDSSPLWVLLQASHHNNDELWITITNISERKQLELSLLIANNTLEEQVADRTKELTIEKSKLQQEITERTRAEKALRESERKFKAVADTSPLAIYLSVGAEQKAEYINPTFIRLFGYTLEDVPTMEHWWPLAYPDVTYRHHVVEEWQRKVELATEARSEFEPVEVVVTCKDGSRKDIQWSFKSIGEQNWAFGLDLTERKRAEEKKLALEQQLLHTQKLESLGVLAGGIAHDFNNILAIIIGYCGLTKMDYEAAEDNILEIEKAAERAAGLCRQMLAYAGKAQPIKTQVNIMMLVDEIVTMLKSTLPQNAVIKTDFSTNIPFLFADASQLQQIVMNLIINASEAIGEVQGEIRVSLARATITAYQADKDYHGKAIPPGEYACLEVTDNGCGMDEETIWRIFEPFFTTKFTGRGLGMSAVLGIIMSHGGALQLFSQPGQGTAFKVYLPAQVSDFAGDENQSPSVPSTPWQGSGTILLVEDEDVVRHIANTLLEMFGFTVLEAVNGKEALELYRKNSADITLVVTDMGMPVMDGYELFRELKQLKPELPIIISSGFSDAEVSLRIAIDDIAGLISKPYNPDQLREVLKKVVEGVPPIHV